MADGMTPKQEPTSKGKPAVPERLRPEPPPREGFGSPYEHPHDADASAQFGVPIPDEAPASSSMVHPTDRLRAVYLLTSEFTEEETTTALTDPPHGRSSPAGQTFTTQPIDRPILLRLDGVSAGEVVSLGMLPATIGRHPGCAVMVDDAGVSRNHAAIIDDGGELHIEDLGSRNGTFIEGERINRAKLTEGCLIQVGLHVGFRFTVVDERQEQILRQLYRSSTRDALTGVYNRRHFDDRFSAELAYAKRHGTDVSLVIVDIDLFKQVNDTYGHAAGDAVLKQVSGTLQQQLRVEDVLSRVGGEEFAVILRGIGATGAARLGERLRSAVEKGPTTFSGTTIGATISVGTATLSELPGRPESNLFALADSRLYLAKRSGRNRVVSES
jgi:diguanylate cyclase (GGDEF)-like protein